MRLVHRRARDLEGEISWSALGCSPQAFLGFTRVYKGLQGFRVQGLQGFWAYKGLGFWIGQLEGF